MLIAEIRRKLPSIEDIDADDPDAIAQIRGLLRETKEDLLTADVFGVLKYLPRRPYLESVLETLAQRNRNSKEFQDALPHIRQNVQDLVFQFWPNYPTPCGLADGRTEPDVQIADDRTLLLFEAKLGSGFGDRQLERELAVAACEANSREFFVVLVTPGSKPPRFRYKTERLQATDYIAAVAATDDLPAEARDLLVANKDRVLWISWEAIKETLNGAHEQHRTFAGHQEESVQRAADMLTDLNTLMLLRQIRPFTGFVGLRNISPEAGYDARPVLLTAPSIQAWDEYQLENVVRVVPEPFGWRCPSSPSTWIPGSFIPFGTCCKSWQLLSNYPLFHLSRKRIQPKPKWNLTDPFLRWASPSGRSGFAIGKAVGQSFRKGKPPHEINMFNLQKMARSWDPPSDESGFEIRRSEQ